MATATAGCLQQESRSDTDQGASAQQDSHEIKKLRGENTALTNEKRLLKERLDEQLAREKRLSAELNRLKYLTARQEVQIKALADAPVERDAYRKRCEELTLQLAQLQKKIAQLQETIAPPDDPSEPSQESQEK